MAIPFNDNIDIRAPKAIDDRWGVFEAGVWRGFVDAEEVDELVVYRNVGLTVLVQGDDGNEEWWFRNGTEIGDLVRKSYPPPAKYTLDPGVPNTGTLGYLNSTYPDAKVGDIVALELSTQLREWTCYYIDVDPNNNKWAYINKTKQT